MTRSCKNLIMNIFKDFLTHIILIEGSISSKITPPIMRNKIFWSAMHPTLTWPMPKTNDGNSNTYLGIQYYIYMNFEETKFIVIYSERANTNFIHVLCNKKRWPEILSVKIIPLHLLVVKPYFACANLLPCNKNEKHIG